MNRMIDLISFGTFGIPNGFRQTSYLGVEDNFVQIKAFDLNTNAIKLFPSTKVYSIRKQKINGYNTIAYAVYSYAKEKNSDRGGTFIGASILFYEQIANENLTISCLNEFHNELVGNRENVDNSVIQVNHSDNFKPPKRPKDFSKLSSCLKEILDINFSITNKDLVVYDLVKPELFQKSLELLNVYDSIFFTKSEEIANFVHEKQLIKLIQSQDFENEIQAFRFQKEEERKRRINQAIEQIKREIAHFEENKKQYADKNHFLIETSKKQVQENDLQIKKFLQQYEQDNQQIQSAINYLQKINQQLEEYKALLEIAVKELQQGERQPEDTLKALEKSKTNVEEAKNRLKIPTIINLSELRNRSTVPNYSHSSKHDYPRNDPKRRSEKSSSKSGIYLMVILLLLLVAAGIFYVFFFDVSSFNLNR